MFVESATKTPRVPSRNLPTFGAGGPREKPKATAKPRQGSPKAGLPKGLVRATALNPAEQKGTRARNRERRGGPSREPAQGALARASYAGEEPGRRVASR